MLYLLLFVAGIIEDFLAILYYKFAQKNYNLLCAIIGFFRSAIWLFMFAKLIENASATWSLGLAYICGCAIGDYVSLKCEPYIEKRILKLKNKGRKKKRWYLLKEEKNDTMIG